MATSNSYVGGSERNFVNDAGISPLNFLKFPAFFHANRISVMQGCKRYARKESTHRCRPYFFSRPSAKKASAIIGRQRMKVRRWTRLFSLFSQ